MTRRIYVLPPNNSPKLARRVAHYIKEAQTTPEKIYNSSGLRTNRIRDIISNQSHHVNRRDLSCLENVLELDKGELISLVEQPIEIEEIEKKKTLGEILRYCRKCKSYTYSEITELINIEDSKLSPYETGRFTPQLSRLRKLADLYGIPITIFDRFVGLSDEDYNRLEEKDSFRDIFRYVNKIRNIDDKELRKKLGLKQKELKKLKYSSKPSYELQKKVSAEKLQATFELKKDLFSKFYLTPEDLKYKEFSTFGKALKYYRKLVGMALAEVGERLKPQRTHQSISQYERDEAFPLNISPKQFQKTLGLPENVFSGVFLFENRKKRLRKENELTKEDYETMARMNKFWEVLDYLFEKKKISKRKFYSDLVGRRLI